MKKILSFDQATELTGWAYYEDKQLKEQGCFSLRKTPTPQRIETMIGEIYKAIQFYNPDEVVFEDVSMQRNPATTIKLGRIQGGIIGYCFAHEISYFIYAPSTWRKILGFNQGKDEFGLKMKSEGLKLQAVQFVKTQFNINETQEDTCDAICIGMAHILKTGG